MMHWQTAWRTAYASVVGTSHLVRETECQDFSTIEYLRDDGLVLLVCDGAGSASHSREGAECAAAAAFSFLQTNLSMDEAMAWNCLEAVRMALRDLARKRGIAFREFSCTFLMTVVRGGKTLTLHIGDGGIVLDFSGRLELVSAPRTAGEYVNVTYFVTSVEPNAQIQTFDKVPARIAMFSDGVEMLGLNLRAQTVHEPFFASLFEKLATESALRDQFNKALSSFLGSDEVNNVTDDDKTLALAVNLEKYRPLPPVRPEANAPSHGENRTRMATPLPADMPHNGAGRADPMKAALRTAPARMPDEDVKEGGRRMPFGKTGGNPSLPVHHGRTRLKKWGKRLFGVVLVGLLMGLIAWGLWKKVSVQEEFVQEESVQKKAVQKKAVQKKAVQEEAVQEKAVSIPPATPVDTSAASSEPKIPQEAQVPSKSDTNR